jgi:hypothetical protein
MTSDEAWSALVSADKDQDLDDFKVYFLEYVRNNKELTFVDLEKKFRQDGLHVYLIAIVRTLYPNLHLTLLLCNISDEFGVGKGNPPSKDHPQSPRRDRQEIPRVLPAWLQKPSYPVTPPLPSQADMSEQPADKLPPRPKRISSVSPTLDSSLKTLSPSASIAAQRVMVGASVPNLPKVPFLPLLAPLEARF